MTILLDSELRQLLDSPRLPFIARKIDAVLADEARRRQGFYAQISEGDKAEFINGQIIFHSPVKLRHNANAKRLPASQPIGLADDSRRLTKLKS